MTSSLFIRSSGLEPIFEWLEQQTSASVEVWGLEEGRRAALLAYGAGADDAFDWSNWLHEAYQDPSELVDVFEDIEIAIDEAGAAALKAAFPGALDAAARRP